MQSHLAPKEDGKGYGRIVMGTGNRPTGIDGSHQRQPDADGCCLHLSRRGHGQLDGKEKYECAYHFHGSLAEFAPKVLHDFDRCEGVVTHKRIEVCDQVSRKNSFTCSIYFPVVSGSNRTGGGEIFSRA